MEVKGCSKRNCWHFCEDIGTVWNGVRPALRCWDITCLCISSFLLKDFSQTEQNQLMSTPPPPPPPHFYYFLSSSSSFHCFSSSSSSSSSFLLFSLLRPLVSFFSTRFYKRLPTAVISSFSSNVSCSEQQPWLSSAVSWLPCSSAPVSFKDSYSTTTTCNRPSLTQYTHGTHSHPRRKQRK